MTVIRKRMWEWLRKEIGSEGRLHGERKKKQRRMIMTCHDWRGKNFERKRRDCEGGWVIGMETTG